MSKAKTRLSKPIKLLGSEINREFRRLDRESRRDGCQNDLAIASLKYFADLAGFRFVFDCLWYFDYAGVIEDLTIARRVATIRYFSTLRAQVFERDAPIRAAREAREAADYEETLRPRPPSTAVAWPWLWAERARDANNIHGKWLVFVPFLEIDEVWCRVKSATEEGRLGPAAKVATCYPNPNAIFPIQDLRLICVYASDGDADATRIRAELREMGIVSHNKYGPHPKGMGYKSDEATHQGQYSARGSKSVCSRWE